VDAQVHIWGADTRDRPWPPGRAHQAQKPYPVTRDLVLAGMKEAGVDRAVLVPPSWEGDRNDLALEAARLYPDRFAVMGRLAIKASALPCYSTEPYPFRGLHKHIRQVYDAFGPRRMFWGTDWTRLTCPWRQAVTLFTEELPWLPGEDTEWIMGRAICEWLGWQIR